MSEEIKETMDDYKEEIDKSFKKISAGDGDVALFRVKAGFAVPEDGNGIAARRNVRFRRFCTAGEIHFSD